MRKEKVLLLGALAILAVLAMAPVQAYVLQNVGGSGASLFNTAVTTSDIRPVTGLSRNRHLWPCSCVPSS